MAQEDFAASRLRNAANSPTEQETQGDRAGPGDILHAVPDFAVSDWLQLVIALELGLIYLELSGGLSHG